VPDQDQPQDDVLQFISEQIDSVPELEALLLLWQHRPNPWTIAELAKRLYIGENATRSIFLDLERKKLIVANAQGPDGYQYCSSSEERDQLIARTERIYRRQIVRISNLIHSKPSSAVRDFARAFRFTKEK
jgi:predicted ArsR family transcriptional regulator